MGLDAVVATTTSRAGVLDPPTLDSAYWVGEYGAPSRTADNTAYLVGHSASRGAAVFDPLFDQAAQVPRVSAGDEVVVTTAEGRLRYRVQATARYPKGELARTDDVWAKVPGRLVLITCFQRDDGRPSTDNLVVTALLEGPAGAASPGGRA